LERRWIRWLNGAFTNDLKEAQIITWFLTGLRHEAIRLAKKQERLRKHELLVLNQLINGGAQDQQLEMLDTIADSKDTIAEVEDIACINQTLSLLTPLQKKVIQELVLNDATGKELAEQLRMSQPAVNRIKGRALKRLKKLVTDRFLGVSNKS